MREAAELALADRLLSQAANWDGGDDGDGDDAALMPRRAMSSMSMDGLALNMLATLAKLQGQAGGGAAPAAGFADGPAQRLAANASLAGKLPRLDDGLGALASRFESGSLGSRAVAWDRTGGTSYGIFQLSSRQGSLQGFLHYLDGAAPEWSRRLREAGPADTGSRHGAMPAVWKAIADENPQLFESLQRSYIVESHYLPAMEAISQATGLDAQALADMPRALHEVVFSTAVQHGPAGAGRIFDKAAEGISQALKDGRDVRGAVRELIERVYAERGHHFGSSEEHVRQAVLNRFVEEKKLALGLLAGDGGMMPS